ncbi:MAG TPA: Lrp/AsnC family transcriptional regulator [Armatimonadota bacterium]|nr:Lrp/AsnC family transcriptional regulator [Armatimonadota bacterium]
MPGNDDERTARLRQAAQDDLPVAPEPFKALAARHDVGEQELLDALREWLRSGIMRRYGALVSHRQLGFAYNAMVVWHVPPERVEEIGRRFAEDPDITHCYERPPAPEFPYNLYTMIHTRTEEECRHKIAHLSGVLDLPACQVLVSTREFKKSSPNYGGAPGDQPRVGEEDEEDA